MRFVLKQLPLAPSTRGNETDILRYYPLIEGKVTSRHITLRDKEIIVIK